MAHFDEKQQSLKDKAILEMLHNLVMGGGMKQYNMPQPPAINPMDFFSQVTPADIAKWTK